MKEPREKGAFLRKCSACGKRMNKFLMIRFVKTGSGEIVLDRSGKAEGRGAYICADPDCLARVMKSARIQKVLKGRISDKVFTETDEYINECQ